MARTVVSLHGDKELIRTLRGLETKLQNKALRTASRKAGKVVATAAKGNAPVDSGQLKRAIKVRAIKRQRNRVGVTVGSSKADYTGEQFYLSFVELGHRIGKRKSHKKQTDEQKAKDTRPFVEPQPFLKPALENNKAQVETVFVSEIRNQINSMGVK